MLFMYALPAPPPLLIATAVGASGATVSLMVVPVFGAEALPARSVTVALTETVLSVRLRALFPFSLMMRRPPSSAFFPYTALFRARATLTVSALELLLPDGIVTL